MRTNAFGFYKKHHNEDADPFVSVGEDRGLLAVADGLGGSGSSVHELTQRDYERLEEKLREAFLHEASESPLAEGQDAFARWVDGLLAPMCDQTPDTSALWGSRVVLSRFVYYFLSKSAEFSDEYSRYDVVRFINDGLNRTRDAFSLRAGDIRGQLLLPTTLVAIQYRAEGEEIVADVVWAGDSRAYALIPGEGLRQLSKDDEDVTGAINNLFCAREYGDRDTTLRYASYRLPKKCALFVCSDGFFDPYSPSDNLGVESVLLTAMAGAEDFDGFQKNWYENYEPMQHDDCSIAFAAFGFESYADFRDAFSERVERVNDLFDDFEKNKKFLPVFLGEEEDPKDYVYERAGKRKEDIVARIATEAFKHENTADPAVTEEVKATLSYLRQNAGEHARTKTQEKEREKCLNIRYRFKNDQACVEGAIEVDPTLAKSELTEKLKDLKRYADFCDRKAGQVKEEEAAKEKAFGDMQQASESGEKVKAEVEERIAELEKVEQYIKAIVENLKRLQTDIREDELADGNAKKYNEDSKFYNRQYNKTRQRIDDMKRLLEKWEKKSKKAKTYSYHPSDEPYYIRIQKAIADYLTAKKEYETAEEEVGKARRGEKSMRGTHYDDKVNALTDTILVEAVREPKKYFSEAFAAEMGLPLQSEEPTLNETDLKEELDKLFSDEGRYLAVIDKVVASSEPSVIEGLFNPTRMRLCRTIGSIDRDHVLGVKHDVDEAKEAYADVEKYKK
ncbi:MAG: hypothetical protein IJ735_07010 [Clostridia bacterium]|nr:hypothetical protein [Clostridia bacterium]